MNDYLIYQKYISDIPEFLYKYLDLDIMKRLKDISYLCGMDYASKDIYDFKFYISRYDHSLSVALITWKFTHDKKQTLAALFHDVATPVFSHVIDYMNHDYKNQESTEEYTGKILDSSKELKSYLKEDGITFDEIKDFKQYSVVDSSRPKMCADRLDGIVATGMAWCKYVKLEDAISLIDNTSIVINEDGEEEISFENKDVALYVNYVNDLIDEYTHTKEDTYMMVLLSNIVKRVIELGDVTYDELFTLTEHDILRIINASCLNDLELWSMWYKFKYVEEITKEYEIEIKSRKINPLVKTKRLY